MQQVSNNDFTFGTQRFKDELIEKQSRMGPRAGNLSIDERLKAKRREEERKLLSSVSSVIPEKRLTSDPLGVNDPNNKGLLNLDHIKSEKIKERLLANVNSGEISDEETKLEYDQESPKQIIRYSDPPSIYRDINDLNLEVAKSLDNLSKLVANLPGSKPETHQPGMNRRSTFLPNNYINNQRKPTADPISDSMNSPRIGDYLLSTDYYGLTSFSPINNQVNSFNGRYKI